MQRITSTRFVSELLKAALLAFLIVAIGQGIWVVVLTLNLKSTPSIPWLILAEGSVLILFWRYAGGWGWPAKTSQRRNVYRRANPVSGNVLFLALIAGILSVVALAGLWIVLYRLIQTNPNPLPDLSAYPPVMVVPAVILASLVSPLFEEVACRGYCQVGLEKVSRHRTAVLLSSIIFAAIHFTQGLEPSKLVFYFLVGVMLGTIALLTNSILPGLIVHAIGDATFFIFIWPHDRDRLLIASTGADRAFWLSLGQMAFFSVLALLAFYRLYRATRNTTMQNRPAAS